MEHVKKEELQNAHPVKPIAAVARPETRPFFGFDLINAPGDAVIRYLLTPGRKRVAFANAHCVNEAARSPEYANALQTADAVLPDGAGVEIALKMQGDRMVENLNGTDFTPRLLTEAARRGLSVFLFGAGPGTAEAAAARLLDTIPGLQIAGTRDGFAGAQDTEAAIDAINASKADILLVAMGVPTQDLWLAKHAHRLTPHVSMGVGALFDFLAGNVRRAPRAVRAAKLEWVWRLAMEPRRMAARYLLGNPIFLMRAIAAAYGRAAIKRSLDLMIAGAAMLVLAPLFLVVAAAITLDSRGSVLFRQTRVGKDGRPFEMLKFRSMHRDAEARRAALLAQSDRAGVCFKSKYDPRVTRVGRILRRFSIDELPQILNVLKGEMSIVGPRPALPSEVAAYPRRALGRLAVKPGITGIWQVSGRAEIGFDKMIDMDLAYARSRSALLDIVLIALTFRAVLSGRGAY